MDSFKAQELNKKYAGVMAYVSVENADGDLNIGSAFHVGEGVFVTARHVVENRRIVQVEMTERSYVKLEGDEAARALDFIQQGEQKYAVHRVDNGVLKLCTGPFFHPDPDVDVAVFQVEAIDPRTPYVHLGSHLDDWLGDSDFVLSEAIVFGFPPIPFTLKPYLVAARAEVNAQIDVRDGKHVHFILSSMPRGGFSGGLALTEAEFILGVITRSLVTNDEDTQLGFFTVLSVEPIYVCLSEHKLLPDCQAEGWDDFWNSDPVAEFFDPIENPDAPTVIAIVASLRKFDDGKRVKIEVTSHDQHLLEEALTSAEKQLTPFTVKRAIVNSDWITLEVTGDYLETRSAISIACEAVTKVFLKSGLMVKPSSGVGILYAGPKV